MKKFQKALSLFLAILMVMTMLPSTALAATADSLYEVLLEPSFGGYLNSNTSGNVAVVRENVYYLPDTGQTSATEQSKYWKPARLIEYTGYSYRYLTQYYQKIREFSAQGYAAAEDFEDKWGIIDSSGNPVVTFKYTYIYSISDDGYVVASTDEQWSTNVLLNLNNGTETPITQEFATYFSSGYTCVAKYNESDWSSIYYYEKADGSRPFSTEYNSASGFSYGYARVRTVGEDVYQIINTAGRAVLTIPTGYWPDGNVSKEGIFAVGGANGRCGYMDISGNWIVSCQYATGSMFQNGYAVVWNEDYETGLIDTKGNEIIPFGRYKSLSNASSTGLVWAIDLNDHVCVLKAGKAAEPTGPADITGLYPANGSTFDHASSSGDKTFHITFDHEVKNNGSNRPELDFGVGTLQVHKVFDGSVVYEVKENSFALGSSSDMTLFGSKEPFTAVSIKGVTAKLDYDTEYYVTAPAGFIKFADGTGSPEITKQDWEFKTIVEPKPSASAPIQLAGKFKYDSQLTKSTEEYKYSYDEDWFFNSGYQHGLAQMSIRLAMAAASTSPSYVKDLYDQLGFIYTDESISYPTPNTDSIGYAIGSKQIIDKDNENEIVTVIAVSVRGGGYGPEWASNFTVGLASEHAGFANAASTVASAVQSYIKSINAKKVKIWITGFSRAAATSNIAAQRFNAWAKSGIVAGLSTKDIFAYCFECPRTVMNDDPSYSANVYDNIFNIVNYIDIVPKVAPEAWGYDRYGVTYYVPSAEQTVKFSDSFDKMLYTYSQIANAAGIVDGGSAAITNAAYFKGQGAFFDKAADKLASFFSDPTTYTVGYQDTLRSGLKALQGGSYDAGTIVNVLVEGIPAFVALHPIVSTKLLANVGNLAHAHYPELCLAWMDSLDGKNDFVDRRTRLLRINCPVDISVYDSDSKLVAQITNNQVVEIEGSTIAAYIDEDDQKVVILPTDDEFTVSMKATDSGTVTYTAIEHNVDNGSAEKVVSYYEVDVTQNDELVGFVENLNEVSSAQYPLYLNGSDESLTPSVEQSGDSVQKFSVEVSRSGNGTVTGGGKYVNGEFAKVTATANTGETFLGWYVNNTPVSSDAEYRFLVDKNISITAKFTGNTPTTPDVPANPSYPVGGGGGYISSTNEITVPTTTGGTVTVSPKSASKGSTVNITTTPDPGYELTSLTVTDTAGKNVEVSNVGGGQYTFTMPNGKVTVNAVFDKVWNNPFTDVAWGAWYYDAVKFVNQNGLMNGVGNGLFAPDARLSRAMLAEILYNKEGRPAVTVGSTFADVQPGAWYADAVAWASGKGIVDGYGNGFFGPNDDITREQVAVMLYRYAGRPVPPNLPLNFSDAYKVSDWAQDAVRWAVNQGILNGKGNGILDPTGKATRAEAAQMLKNYLKK